MRPFSAHLLLCQEIQVRKIKRVDSLTARDMDTIPIKRVDKLTNAEFLESYRNKRPVIISDVAANWKAVALWKDPAYLKEKVGAKRADEKFPVFVAPDNLRFLAKGADIEPMTLNELIDRVFSDNSEGKKRLYLRGPPLNEVMSDLDPEPAFVLDKNEHFSERMSGVWIGTAGNITPIHFDMWHGILTQIVGDKKVAMFHPDESNLLYPHSSLTANPHTSQVDLREWDQDPAVRSKYPKMQHATKYTAVLLPGDSLYIPPCWWHDVESLDNCISYTTRWEIGTRESIHPAAIK